jgi:hypothetical protein
MSEIGGSTKRTESAASHSSLPRIRTKSYAFRNEKADTGLLDCYIPMSALYCALQTPFVGLDIDWQGDAYTKALCMLVSKPNASGRDPRSTFYPAYAPYVWSEVL